jgi:hypothetical protein
VKGGVERRRSKTETVESRYAHCFGAQIDKLIFDLRTLKRTRPEVCSTKSMFQTHNRICHTSRCDERYCS